MLYRIRNIKNNLLWSNDWGWGGMGFDTFTQREMQQFNLPVEGTWEFNTEIPIWEQNALNNRAEGWKNIERQTLIENEEFEHACRQADWTDEGSDNN